MRALRSVALVAPLLLSFAACSGGSDAVFGPDDGGDEAASDGSADVTSGDDASSDTGEDTTIGDSGSDAASDATKDANDGAVGDANDAGQASDATDASDAMDASDAKPTAELVSPGCPYALAVAAGTVYWTEPTAFGCATAAIRACPVTGCATTPAAIYSNSGSQSLPIGIGVPATNEAVFYGDNQSPNNYLWKLLPDGGAPTAWGIVGGNQGPVAVDTTDVYWGNQSGVFRVPISSGSVPTAADVFAGSFGPATNQAPEEITLDANNVYALKSGSTIVSCPKGADCKADAGTGKDLGGEAGLLGIVTDGTYVFAVGGMSSFVSGGPERLLRVPADGSSAPVLLAETDPTTNGDGTHMGVAVDATNVYWGTMEGVIYACAKSAAAPCTPSPVVSGTRPYAMLVDNGYLYWADKRGGVYRIHL